MIDRQAHISETWLRAAITGSLWASLEIVLGSFLHNVRMPFAGTLLAAFGVMVMVAFGRRWGSRGFFLRSALICAMLKSLSPSAVILGPMIGILLEGLLMEAAFRLLGKSFMAFALGGVLALLSALGHKGVSLVIIYGFDIVRIGLNMYEYLCRLIGVPGLDISWLIIILGLIYIGGGLFSSWIGWKASREMIPAGKVALSLTDQRTSPLDTQNGSSILLLITNLLLIIAGMWLAEYYTPAMFAFVAAYLLFIVIKYPRALRRFHNYSFWLQLAFIALAAFFFYAGPGLATGDYMDSLMAGGKMLARAVLIISGFAAVSIELRNPLIKTFLAKRGYQGFYHALSLAFAILPALILNRRQAREIIRSPGRSISSMMGTAGALEAKLKTPGHKTFLLIGDRSSGKTTWIKKLISELKTKGISCAGAISLSDKDKSKYHIRNIISGEELLLCSKAMDTDLHAGAFGFDQQAIDRGREWLIQAAQQDDTALLIVDEAGPLEMRGGGWWPVIEQLCCQVPMLISVREGIANSLSKKLGGKTVYIRVADDMTEIIEEIQQIRAMK